jgi:hypothetical protein
MDPPLCKGRAASNFIDCGVASIVKTKNPVTPRRRNRVADSLFSRISKRWSFGARKLEQIGA